MPLLELGAEHGHGTLAVPEGFSMNPLEDYFKVIQEVEESLAWYAKAAEGEGWGAIQ